MENAFFFPSDQWLLTYCSAWALLYINWMFKKKLKKSKRESKNYEFIPVIRWNLLLKSETWDGFYNASKKQKQKDPQHIFKSLIAAL